MKQIEIAQKFAHKAHDLIGQKRKYTGEPYWTHTDEVAQIVFDAVYPADYSGTNSGEEAIILRDSLDAMIIAAHLHDYREDVVTKLFTDGRLNELRELENEYWDVFTPLQHTLVQELTDVYTKANYPNLNRKARHVLENERLAHISAYGQTVKLADIISNTPNIVQLDRGFARTYLKELTDLLPRLDGGNKNLFNIASWKLAAEIEKFNS